MTAIDIHRGTTNVVLPAEVAGEVWGKVLEDSAIMTLSQRIDLPGNGVAIQTITGEPEAEWVAETAAKPVSTHTFGKKTITPYKLAVIEPFSMEFVRDADKLYAECIRRMPYALAKKFDQTVLGTAAPGSGFDVLGNAQKISLASNQYAQLVAADAAISAADGVMNGIAIAPSGKSLLIGAVDGMGRPLFTPGVNSQSIGTILGADVVVNKGMKVAGSPNIVGLAGDFNDARYGTVEGVKMSISDQATLTTSEGTINLWQQNMVAVRFEIEVAFAVKNVGEFVLLTD